MPIILFIDIQLFAKHGEIEHGQVTRTNHKGEKYHVTVADANPADISKVAYEHNILMK